MGVTRTALKFETDFTRIPNEWARDERLSRRARGLLVEIMSHRVGWHITTRSLAKTGKEGRDAIRAALTELLEHGYLRRVQGRNEAGTFGEVEYELCDPATVAGFTDRGSTVAGSAVAGESDHKEEHLEEDQHVEDQLLVPAVADTSALDELWGLWPSSRRSTRKVVERSLRAAMKVASWQVIRDAARAHAGVWASWPVSEHRFVPLLSTWLNQERWTAEVPEPRGGRLSTVDAGRAADAMLAAQERLAVAS